MRFAPGWDVGLIEMLHQCDAGEKAVLTGMTPNYWLTRDSEHHVDQVVMDGYDDNRKYL